MCYALVGGDYVAASSFGQAGPIIMFLFYSMCTLLVYYLMRVQLGMVAAVILIERNTRVMRS